MSPLDIVLVIIILAGAYGGYKNGFIVALFSLVAIVLGLLGGFKLMGWAMVLLADKYNVDQKVLPYLAFVFVFLIILVCVGLIGRVIKVAVGRPLLGQFDQTAGGLLGLLKTTFMLSVVLWISDSLKINFPEHWTTKSWLHPITAAFAPKIADWIGRVIPLFEDIL